MTWENGRELATATSGNTSLAFTYDGNGIRTSKTVNGVEHKYYYSGGKLLRETYGNNILDFAYNPDGSLYSFRYNQTYYYYVTNLQGDVIGIVDANGNTVASYEYDPYGDVISATGSLAETNPMRYRGYYYDTETGLYYVSSRYYDPEIGRFINADSLVSTGQGILGNNMFAYCLNNPVNYVDKNGTEGEALQWWIGAMWWLPAADTLLIVGDIIYYGGIAILSIGALYTLAQVVPEVSLEEEKDATELDPPDVTYPGDDPAEAPDGYEWRGPDEQGGKRGGYANPNGKDSWHPDLDHPDGVDPHWDYNDGLGHKWRVFPDRIEFVLK